MDDQSWIILQEESYRQFLLKKREKYFGILASNEKLQKQRSIFEKERGILFTIADDTLSKRMQHLRGGRGLNKDE